jgi:hypothetical protein
MPRTKNKQLLRFIYSYPYEEALLKLSGKQASSLYHNEGQNKTKIVQKVWNKYEKKILNVFSYVYRIKIAEKKIMAYISSAAPNSFSNPLTISLKHWPDIEKNPRSKKGFIYTVIHELAHYFSYTRGKETRFNKLLTKIQKMNLLNDHGANLHYLIQAVEFGIIGEVFGSKYAKYRRSWIVKNWNTNQYGKSAALLEKHKVPFDKTCLDYIEKLFNKTKFLK